MNYETAKLFLANAVAADPFRMEHFRKYGFWAKIVIAAEKNGKASIAKNAWAKMDALEDEIDVFADITGVMPAIYHEARKAFKAACAAS